MEGLLSTGPTPSSFSEYPCGELRWAMYDPESETLNWYLPATLPIIQQAALRAVTGHHDTTSSGQHNTATPPHHKTSTPQYQDQS